MTITTTTTGRRVRYVTCINDIVTTRLARYVAWRGHAVVETGRRNGRLRERLLAVQYDRSADALRSLRPSADHMTAAAAAAAEKDTRRMTYDRSRAQNRKEKTHASRPRTRVYRYIWFERALLTFFSSLTVSNSVSS